MEKEPLISIIIITYNSSKFILDTLESVKEQNYRNLELIVTDDCSLDNTVNICSNWIEDNKDRFVRTELITFKENTGIAPNCNRGLFKAKGEWIKLIGGDDALESFYCNHIINYAKKNPDALCIITNVTKYKDFFTENNIIFKSDLKKELIFKVDNSPQNQFQYLLYSNMIYTAGVIIHKKVYDNLGFYDEKYPFAEDFPFWIKITKSNIKIHFLDIYGAKYRIHSNSVQQIQSNVFWSKYRYSCYLFNIEKLKYYPHYERFLRRIILQAEYCCYKVFNNKKNVFISIVLFVFIFLPRFMLNMIVKKKLKNGF